MAFLNLNKAIDRVLQRLIIDTFKAKEHQQKTKGIRSLYENNRSCYVRKKYIRI